MSTIRFGYEDVRVEEPEPSLRASVWSMLPNTARCTT